MVPSIAIYHQQFDETFLITDHVHLHSLTSLTLVVNLISGYVFALFETGLHTRVRSGISIIYHLQVKSDQNIISFNVIDTLSPPGHLGGVMASKLDKHNFMSEFEPQWVIHSYGFVIHLSKRINK